MTSETFLFPDHPNRKKKPPRPAAPLSAASALAAAHTRTGRAASSVASSSCGWGRSHAPREFNLPACMSLAGGCALIAQLAVCVRPAKLPVMFLGGAVGGEYDYGWDGARSLHVGGRRPAVIDEARNGQELRPAPRVAGAGWIGTSERVCVGEWVGVVRNGREMPPPPRAIPSWATCGNHTFDRLTSVSCACLTDIGRVQGPSPVDSKDNIMRKRQRSLQLQSPFPILLPP